MGHRVASLRSCSWILSGMDVARRVLARYLEGAQLVTKEFVESLAKRPGLSPITTTKLQALARALDYESITPFPLAELPLYLTERGVPEEEADALGKVRGPSPKAKQLSWHDAYALLSRATGKSVVYEGGLEHDTRAVTSALVWAKAVKALKPKARQVFDHYVKKVRLRSPRGSEDASWEHGGVVALVVGKTLTPAVATSYLTHELGHAVEEAHPLSGAPWGAPPFVSAYAESRPETEDFAECFRVFIEKPGELRRVSSPKFEAMRGIIG